MTAPAAAPYDAIAEVYDLISAGYTHDRWIAAILERCREHGLTPRNVLDVACGSGSSFLPMLDHGLAVSACDISSQMVAIASRRARGRCQPRVADMRALPDLGTFDLVTCLDDAINHLQTPADVQAALHSMRKQLAPDGILVLDAIQLCAYTARADHVFEHGGHYVVWRKPAARQSVDDHATAIIVDIFTQVGNTWARTQFTQHHRHYPLDQLRRLARNAGLEVLHVYGQRRGGTLDDTLVETGQHHKALLLFSATTAQQAQPTPTRKEKHMHWGP